MSVLTEASVRQPDGKILYKAEQSVRSLNFWRNSESTTKNETKFESILSTFEEFLSTFSISSMATHVLSQQQIGLFPAATQTLSNIWKTGLTFSVYFFVSFAFHHFSSLKKTVQALFPTDFLQGRELRVRLSYEYGLKLKPIADFDIFSHLKNKYTARVDKENKVHTGTSKQSDFIQSNLQMSQCVACSPWQLRHKNLRSFFCQIAFLKGNL